MGLNIRWGGYLLPQEFSSGVVLGKGNLTHTIVLGCSLGIPANTDSIRQAKGIQTPIPYKQWGAEQAKYKNNGPTGTTVSAGSVLSMGWEPKKKVTVLDTKA